MHRQKTVGGAEGVTPNRSEGSEGDGANPAAAGPVPTEIGNSDPRALWVLGVVKPISPFSYPGMTLPARLAPPMRAILGREEILLDFGGGAGGSSAPHRVDVVGVVHGESKGDRCFDGRGREARPLPCRPRAARRARVRVDAVGRRGARKEIFEHAANRRDALPRDFRADGERHRDLFGKGGGPGESLHARPVEVNHIDGSRRHTGQALCLGDDLSPS